MSRQRALVTGAGRRIGREMALYLAGRGFDVAVHYNASASPAEAVVSEIEMLGQQAVALQADLTVEEETQALLARATDGLGGPLTLLVNNASIFEPDTLSTGTRKSWDRHLESNLRAPVVLTQKFSEQAPIAIQDSNGEMRARAAVVNMIDQRVRKLTPAFMSYTLAKTALWTFTRTAAQALAPNIRVNAIGPGPTMINERQSEAHFAAQRAACLLERGTNPEDVVAALGYLLDAQSVTGQLICVDGGQHLLWQTPDVGIAE